MKQNKKLYTQAFYNSQIEESLTSAKQVVPEIIKLFNPKSVIDVGCGVGTWSSVFIENNIPDVLGIDGDYINLEQLLIPKENFQSYDLRQKITINKKFDIAISLEVIEHLTDNEGKELIKSLTELAPIVILSAAIPGQGGTNHINERFQSYWAREFQKYNYNAHDSIRPIIWSNKDVYVCYKQNIVAYISSEYKKSNPTLQFENQVCNTEVLDVIHPDLWSSLVKSSVINVNSIQRHYFQKIKNLIKRIINK